MYAVIKTGGKQYRVVTGEKLKVEQMPTDVGTEITLDQVLLVGEGESVTIGSPMVAGAQVKATVLAQGRHPKIQHFQDAPAQALPETSGASPELHGNPHRRNFRLRRR